MNEYKKPYLILFNAITNAIERIEEFDIFEAKFILLKAQIDAEEAYLSSEKDQSEPDCY